MPSQGWSDKPDSKPPPKHKLKRRRYVRTDPTAVRPHLRLVDRMADPGALAMVMAWAAGGATDADISLKLGCTNCAFRKFLDRNPRIARRIARARLKIKEEAEAQLRRFFQRDWRACAFYLERRHKDDYGTANANSVDLRKLLAGLRGLAASIRGVIPEAARAAVDMMLSDFIEKMFADEGGEQNVEEQAC